MDVLKTMRAVTRSPDLWHQYHPHTGEPVGHRLESTAGIPNWMQMGKLTGHPLTISLVLLAIHVNAGQEGKAAHTMIDQLSAVVKAIQDIEAKFRARGKPRATEETLSEEQRAATAAASAVVEAQPSMSLSQVSALLGPRLKAVKQQRPSVPNVLALYPQSKLWKAATLDRRKVPLHQEHDGEARARDCRLPC